VPVVPHPARLLAILPLLALPALAPASASADYASANTWAGGSVGAGRSALTGQDYPARGALVSLVTGPSRARMWVSVRSDRCVVNGALRGTTEARPGGVGDLQTVAVTASRVVVTKLTTGRSRTRVTVTLTPGGPGLLVGTVEARGRVTLRGRSRPCVLREAVTVRSRAALATPLAPATTDVAATRTGVVGLRLAGRVPGAIALTKRRDGSIHGLWSVHQTCRSGSKRSADDYVNVGKRFRIRKDGTFRGRESFTRTKRLGKRRSRLRFVATISGRIDADGIARGRIAVHSREKEAGYYDLVCTVPSTPFAAAP
jgi:hypothetical protein